MIVSITEARELLNKFASGSGSIAVVSDLAFVAFVGSIKVVASNGIVIAHRDGKELLTISLNNMPVCEYEDLREAPERIRQKYESSVVSMLSLKSTTVTCVIYELV